MCGKVHWRAPHTTLRIVRSEARIRMPAEAPVCSPSAAMISPGSETALRTTSRMASLPRSVRAARQTAAKRSMSNTDILHFPRRHRSGHDRHRPGSGSQRVETLSRLATRSSVIAAGFDLSRAALNRDLQVVANGRRRVRYPRSMSAFAGPGVRMLFPPAASPQNVGPARDLGSLRAHCRPGPQAAKDRLVKGLPLNPPASSSGQQNRGNRSPRFA